jgi:copper chaperone CopZ
MSCGGCVSNVKRAALLLPDVTEANVQLNPQSVVLTMSKPVDEKELQAQLKKAGLNYLGFFRPLLLIF